MLAGGLLGAGGFYRFSRITDHSTYVNGLLGPMLVTVAGLGLIFVPLFLVAVSGVRDEDSGLASSLANTGQQVGGAIGLAALGTIVWGAVAHSTRTQLAHAAAAAARAGQPVPALRSSAQIPLPILHHALASDISRGFVVGAGIMLAAVRPGRRAQRPHRHAVTALLWEGTVSSVGSGPAIVVDGLTKSFGDVRALRGIDLAVSHATVLGLLGPNGAG